MLRILKASAFIIAGTLGGLLVIAQSGDQELLIESKESKTINGEPVFNKIRWFKFKDKEIWMMNQSHHGESAQPQSWDRLAIVVDQTKSPPTAKYFQFEPGPLEWRENLPQKSFSVSCFRCHNNGPRAIRPNAESRVSPIDLRKRIRISYLNLRMKMYGRVVPHPSHQFSDAHLQTPYRLPGSFENESLQVPVCLRCHKETGFLARGLLRRQQFPTIRFMIESGAMPPLGFHMSQQERKDLEMFLQGF